MGRVLKGCPFCGGEIEHYSIGYTGPKADSLSVQCDKCHLYLQIDLEHIRYSSTEDLSMDAIDIFNCRSSGSEVKETNNNLKFFSDPIDARGRYREMIDMNIERGNL